MLENIRVFNLKFLEEAIFFLWFSWFTKRRQFHFRKLLEKYDFALPQA
jgi:hypothetical protein